MFVDPTWQLVLAGLAVYIGFTLSTVTGFGGGLISLPILAFLFGMRGSSPLVATLGGVLAIYLVIRHWKHVRMGAVLQLFLRALPGFILGIYLFNNLPEGGLKIFTGIFALWVAIFPQLLEKPKKEEGIATNYGVPLAAGVAHGTTACAGPLVVFFIMRKVADKHGFRATMMMSWIVLNAVFLTAYFTNYGLQQAYLSRVAVTLLCGIAAVATGERIHSLISPKAFRLLVRGILFVSGISLTIAGGYQLLQ
jgi:uncharacterized membrane protein YfcA